MSNVAGLVNTIDPLNGTNFPVWKEKVLVVLGLSEHDHALRDDRPIAPDENANADALREYHTELEKWEKSNRIASMIMKALISLGIKGAIPDKKEDGEKLTAKEFLASIEENFKSSSKTYANTLIMKMCTSRYDGQG